MNRVLLVNDHAEIRDRTAAMLEQLGWEVYVAASEDAVFEFVVACRPAFVVVDMEMARSVGLESIATVRTLFSDLFVIAASRGSDRELLSRMATECGANAFVAGPVSSTKLTQAIEIGVIDGLIDDRPFHGGAPMA